MHPFPNLYGPLSSYVVIRQGKFDKKEVEAEICNYCKQPLIFTKKKKTNFLVHVDG